MKFQATICTVALGIASVAGPAFAQDRSTHFDGPYVSIAGGLAAHSNDRGDTLVFDTDGDGDFDNTVFAGGGNAFAPGFCSGVASGTGPSNCFGDDNAEEYAVRLGYDRRVGNNLVGGILVEVSKNEATDYVSGFSTTPARYTLSRQIDYAVALRGRVGFTPGGGALFYLTGGPALAKIDHGFTTTNTANAFTEVDDGKWVWGGQVGGGAEVMVTDNISLGFEYLFNRFHDDKYGVAVTQGTAPSTNPFIQASSGTGIRPSDTNYRFHSLRASLSFQF